MNPPWETGSGLGFDGTGPLFPFGKWNEQQKREVSGLLYVLRVVLR